MKVASLVIVVSAIGALGACRSTRPLKTDGGGGSMGGTGAGAAGTTGAGGAGGTGGAGGACYGLFHECANFQECCAPYVCISINGGPKCQLEGPMTGNGGTGGTGGASGSGGASGAGGSAEVCSGDSPRMVVNGLATTPTVVGQEQVLDCCRAGRIVVTTADFDQPIAFNWRYSGPGLLPITADLGNLSTGWSVNLLAGCNVTQAGCLGPHDSFNSGFTGELSVSRLDAGIGMDMSLCLHFVEPAGMPGTLVHTLDLYAPHVSTRN